jgi:hypothetical protein
MTAAPHQEDQDDRGGRSRPQWLGRVEAADRTTIGAAGSAAMRVERGAAHPRFPPPPPERCSGLSSLDNQAFSQVSAPGRIRTRDPLLRRYRRMVAGRRLASPYKPSSSSYCSGLSEGVARSLPPLAPLLAHLNLVALANVRINENNVENELLGPFRPQASHPTCDAMSSKAVRESARSHPISSDWQGGLSSAEQGDLSYRASWMLR